MQTWQIRALELEAAGLKHLDGFMHEHALGFFIGAIGFLLILLAWIFCGGLRRKMRQSSNISIGILIQPSASPPPIMFYDHVPDCETNGEGDC